MKIVEMDSGYEIVGPLVYGGSKGNNEKGQPLKECRVCRPKKVSYVILWFHFPFNAVLWLSP